ncbi:LRR receptor serine/threonine-protein kinase [Salix suchowensis]|nr:LRR receptor serine/threonine-protein kinase [Salix suchowensis]
MSSVVRMLEGNIPVKAPIINHGGTDQEARFKAFQLLSQESQTQVSTSSQSSEVQRSRSRMDHGSIPHIPSQVKMRPRIFIPSA